jgi:fucose permease
MVQRSEIVTVYVGAMLQGIALVTFPAAGGVFTSPADFGLSDTEYGAMFAPQVVMAIISSLLGAAFILRLGAKCIYLLGLVANLAAMALLVGSKFVMHQHTTAFGMLLAATACMGIGFGLTVPALNTLAAAFFPRKVDKAILALNALLGLGTTLAPVFIAVFVALKMWWGLPVLVGVLLLGLLLFSLPQKLDEAEQPRTTQSSAGKAKFPARFWVFALFALLYGICETMNGNWASLFMSNRLGANALLASIALALFWGTVTAGRVLFAIIGKWFPEPVVFRVLPIVVTTAFVICASLPKTAAGFGLLAFGLAGLGCSALLPLMISFGQEELKPIASSVAGGLIAFYQLGYGVAAFGVGPLETRAGLQLNSLYGGAAVVAFAMAVLSFVVVGHEERPVTEPV